LKKNCSQKRLGLIQSNYIPWRGYFDFINTVDLFLIYDDVKYPMGRSWRNRNQLKFRTGLKWLTVPVQSGAGNLSIDEVRIGQCDKPWQDRHSRMIEASLGKAPYFNDVMELWSNTVAKGYKTISSLNVSLIKQICAYLQISTPILMSRDFEAFGTKTDRIINLLKKANATIYLSGPAAKDYLDEELFRKNGIRLEYKTYDYPPYFQLWGEFAGNVSVLDFIANTGPEAKCFLKSLTPDVIAVI